MTLWVPPGISSYSSGSHLTTEPYDTAGASLTPGTSAYGSWVNLMSTTRATCTLIFRPVSNFANATSKNTVIKLGIDYAGGSSYSDLTPGLVCGSVGPTGSVEYIFPFAIPSGAAIAAAAYSTATNVVRCTIMLQGSLRVPSAAGTVIEAIGLSGYTGTSLGAPTTAETSWVALGTTTRPLWAWEIGVQGPTGDTAWVGGIRYHFDLAWGDSSNKHMLIENCHGETGSSESIAKASGLAFGAVPAGATLYARHREYNDATGENLQLVAYGVGG